MTRSFLPFNLNRFYVFALLVLLPSSLLVQCASTPRGPITPPNTALQDPAQGQAVAAQRDYTEGYDQYLKGNMRGARQNFQKALAGDPEHTPSLLAMGYTYFAEDDLETAEQYIRQSLEFSPDYAQAHYALALIHENRQEYDSALAELSEVARINPDYPSLQANINLMKLKATERHLNEAKRLSESNPEQALVHLKAARELAPEIARIPMDIADILIRQQNCREAVPYLEAAMENSTNNFEPKQKLAGCFADLGRYQEALSLYEELSVFQPGNPEISSAMEALKKQMFVSSLPPEYQMIAATEQLTRAQFAALLMVNLEFLRGYTTEKSQIITDTIHHWAKPFIQRSVNLGIIDLFPNRTFQPNRPITRLELAKAASRILEILELRQNRSLSGNEPVNIPDINTGNVYYPMISKALSARVIALDGDGRFHPGRAVPGSEAISMVNRIRQLTESA